MSTEERMTARPITDAAQVAEWGRLADAASEGPLTIRNVWLPDESSPDGHMAYAVVDASGLTIATDAIEEDTEFIAAARTAVPALVADVEALRAEVERLTAWLANTLVPATEEEARHDA